MQDKHIEENRMGGWPLRGMGGLVLALSAVILMAGGGAAWWSWTQLASTTNDSSPTNVEGNGQAPTSTETPSDVNDGGVAIAPTIATPVTVYFLDTTDTGMELVPITLDAQVEADATEDPAMVLTATFDQLLNGDVTEEGAKVFSAIPVDTELLDLSVNNDGVYVNLSDAFEGGGGSASMIGRLTQVMYTATSLDAEQPVWLAVEGEPLELLGGEGLEISQPMTRADVDAGFPLF